MVKDVIILVISWVMAALSGMFFMFECFTLFECVLFHWLLTLFFCSWIGCVIYVGNKLFISEDFLRDR